MAEYTQIGSIREGKYCSDCGTELDGDNPENRVCPECGNTVGKLYIRIDDASKIKDGDFLMIDKPQDKLKFFLDGEYITKKQYEDRMKKIPWYIKYEITKKS